MESRSTPRPRSRRLQALARRTSRRAFPRSILEVVGVSWRLVRRLARVPFVPWKALRTDNVCLPTVVRGSKGHCGSVSLTQRKQHQQPRRRIQRIKSKERPAAAAAGSTAAGGTAAAAAAGVACGKRPAAAAEGSSQGPPSSSSSKKPSSKRASTGSLRGTADSLPDTSVVTVSPSSSFCCAASVTSESNTGNTCSSSSGVRTRLRAKRTRDSSRRSSGSVCTSAVAEAPSPLSYPAVQGCRPRIFFITLSSVKRQAIIKLSIAATRRQTAGGGVGSDSTCRDDRSTRTSSAKIDSVTTNTTAATDKAASPIPHLAGWPPMMPHNAAASAADGFLDNTETATAGDES